MKIKTSLNIAIASALAAASLPLHAAPTVATPAQWETALNVREQRADLLRDEITALDTRIEGRIERILAALKSVGDSKDSRTKVARMKEQTIEALKKNISYYQSKRAALQEEMRRPTLRLTDEQMRKGIAAFDEHMEKRIEQILAVQKSLPAHQDFERYKVTATDWHGTTYEMNEDFQQNQRVTAYTNSQRKEIADGLRGSIARIEQLGRTLKAQGAPGAEIDANEAVLADRREQLAAALMPEATPTRAISQKEALDLDAALQTSIADLRKEFTTLFARYSAFLQELSKVNATRDALRTATKKTP